MENKILSTFAAANGFTGFRSYFNEIFDPYKLRHIFILKGGPGTGKSTFMKTILNSPHFQNNTKEAIYCSSDPSSLDGVIIDGSIAVIDGTSPHATDPMLPGVIDEIINLGENWSTEALIEHEAEVKRISLSKSNFYNSAYKYLSIIKDINGLKFEILKSSTNFERLKSDVKNILPKAVTGDKSIKTRIKSSFGRAGYKPLSEPFCTAKRRYEIPENHGSGYLVMSEILNYCEGKYKITKFPSPFDDKLIEAVFIDEYGILFEIEKNSEKSDFQNSFTLSQELEKELIYLESLETSLLEKSEMYFASASNEHSRLEKIYSAAMDFEKNQLLLLSVIDKIRAILKT